ncbi:unnamed protein product [Prorocentrum cordatum]|uniref:Uncharacterized protein n=1 Tax=Prorocentrum cordatum TaxID=2364126 RepID=A0ABN9TI40_9DINO|nr:unnamed protein product [Polarella glacialis]
MRESGSQLKAGAALLYRRLRRACAADAATSHLFAPLSAVEEEEEREVKTATGLPSHLWPSCPEPGSAGGPPRAAARLKVEDRRAPTQDNRKERRKASSRTAAAS